MYLVKLDLWSSEIWSVDIKTFKSHSVRSVSTSKAKSLGVSTKHFLKRGRWCSKSTWQKFYNKEIVSHEETKFGSILALWTEDEEIPFLQTCAVRSGELSIRSTEILWNKIENYKKARSACIVIKILWKKIEVQSSIIPPSPDRGKII